MAEFVFEKIKLGFKDREIKITVALKDIIFGENDEVIYIPEVYDGLPVTHIAYKQGIQAGHYRWHDWHHSSQGEGDYIEDEYVADPVCSIHIPRNVKRIVFPKSTEAITMNVFNYYADRVCLEFEEGIKHFKIQNRKIAYK